MANGAASLSEAELLAIIINSGQKGRNAVDLARDLLRMCDNSLVSLSHTLLQGSDEERQALLKGIGPAKMCHIQAAFELGLRLQNEQQRLAEANLRIDSSQQIFNLFNQQLSQLDHEELWAVYCSRNGRLLCKRRISEGGVSFSGCDVRKVCRPAIEYMASCVALCHNHPHSSAKPSRQDLEVTRTVSEALRLLDVRLLDHIIISDGQYYSMSDNGEM